MEKSYISVLNEYNDEQDMEKMVRRRDEIT